MGPRPAECGHVRVRMHISVTSIPAQLRQASAILPGTGCFYLSFGTGDFGSCGSFCAPSCTESLFHKGPWVIITSTRLTSHASIANFDPASLQRSGNKVFWNADKLREVGRKTGPVRGDVLRCLMEVGLMEHRNVTRCLSAFRYSQGKFCAQQAIESELATRSKYPSRIQPQ